MSKDFLRRSQRVVVWAWPLFAAVGLITLAPSLTLVVAPAALVLAAVAKVPRAAEWSMAFLGALLWGVLALLGFNRALDEIDADVGIRIGLLLALLFCGGGAFAFLRLWPCRRSLKASLWLSAAVAALFVLVLPPAVALIRQGLSRTTEPLAQPLESKLDVLIVLPRPQSAPAVAYTPPEYPGVSIQYSLGFLRQGGTAIDWRVVDASDPGEVQRTAIGGGVATRDRPELRGDADHVLLAAVDGTPAVYPDPAQLPAPASRDRDSEVRRWREAVRRIDPREDVVAFALLHGSGEQPRRRWDRWSGRGDAVFATRLGGNSLADAAVRLAASSTTAFEERELAERHRPILLFDRGEPAPRPLLISELFDEGHVRFCESQHDEDCPVVTDPRQLANGGTHLRLDLPPARELRALAEKERPRRSTVEPGAPARVPEGTLPAPATPQTERRLDATAMYFHTTTLDRGRRRLVFLDYWWYIPYNPTDESDDGFCGPGLVTPGLTCFTHQSDWEGLTVVLERPRVGDPEPVEVHYAQHDHVVRYHWKALREFWDSAAHASLLRQYADARERPLAFSARGSHSTYPHRCTGGCEQVSEDRKEYRHDGRFAWARNHDEDCDLLCLEPLPVRAGGTLPASWNAFKGEWGEADCRLRFYCDSGIPPKSPGAQLRYEDPTHFDGTARPDGSGYEER